MLGILLTILKIILWVILGILGLVLLLLLLVLFCPIRYKVRLDYHEKAYVEATIRYMIVSVRVLFDQKTKDMQQIIRVCGFRIGKGKKKPVQTEEEDTKKEADEVTAKEGTKKEADEVTAEESTKKDAGEATAEEGTKKDAGEATAKESTKKDAGEATAEEGTKKDAGEVTEEMVDPMYDLWDEEFTEPLPEGEKKLFGRIVSLLKKIINTISKLSPTNIINKINSKKAALDKKINRVKKFWNLSCTVKTRSYLMKYLKSIFKHISPRKVKGYIHYGFDEPYKTGQITGYLSWMPFMYQKHLSIQPDFYNKIIEADLCLKGKIRIGYLARIALNINVWRTIKALRRITK